MVATIQNMYLELNTALMELNPTPADELFSTVWELHLETTHRVGVRLMEAEMGSNLSAAREVQIFLEYFRHVSNIAEGMPLRVPAHAVEQFKIIDRYLQGTPDCDELVEYLMLSSATACSLSEYATRVLGRNAAPLRDQLILLARIGAVFAEYLNRTGMH